VIDAVGDHPDTIGGRNRKADQLLPRIVRHGQDAAVAMADQPLLKPVPGAKAGL
jgi:hypothetical protein